jgi:hypothetical protein
MKSEGMTKGTGEHSKIHIGDLAGSSGGTVNIETGSIPDEKGRPSVQIDSGSYVAGNIYTGGGDFIARDYLTPVEAFQQAEPEVDPAIVDKLFDPILADVERMKVDDLHVLVADCVNQLKAEAALGQAASPSEVAGRMRMLTVVAPQIAERVRATFREPQPGISRVFWEISQQL